MRIAVVYVGAHLSGYTLDRARRLCGQYFAGHELHYFDIGPGELPRSVREAAATFDAIVLSEDLASHQQELPPSARAYLLQHNGVHVMLRLQTGSINATDYAHIDAHAFNRLGPERQWDTMEFFPYGYIYRETGLGPPVDPFGFRIGEDLASFRATRRADETLIAVLGGSSVWSWFCFPEETFCAQLQRLLNESTRRRRQEPVRVLNFGQGGATVLHQMQTFLLHIDALEPDIVITQDGFNDVIWGMTTDPFLLRRGICAPHVFESWSARLHGHADDELRFAHGHPVTVVNPPAPILEAYLHRKAQIDRLVRSNGAAHLAGLQPYAGSKGAHSPSERRTLEQERYIWVWQEPYRRVGVVYEQLSDLFDARVADGINFHRLFRAFGSEDTLFQDIVHTTPDGELRIAEAFAAHILDRGLV